MSVGLEVEGSSPAPANPTGSPDVSLSGLTHRYLAIRYPLHSRELRTPRNAMAAIGLIWGLSLLFSGPYLSYYRQSRLANLTV